MTNSRARKNSIVRIKAADETENSNQTVQDDDELTIAASKIKGSTRYAFQIYLIVNSDATAKFKYRLKAGNTGTRTNGAWNATTPIGSDNINTEVSMTTDDSDQIILITGFVLTASTPIEITLQWAQVLSDASDTIVRAGSYMVLFQT